MNIIINEAVKLSIVNLTTDKEESCHYFLNWESMQSFLVDEQKFDNEDLYLMDQYGFTWKKFV